MSLRQLFLEGEAQTHGNVVRHDTATFGEGEKHRHDAVTTEQSAAVAGKTSDGKHGTAEGTTTNNP